MIEQYLSDVHVGQVRYEVIPHQEPHQDPVVDDVLQVVGKRELTLAREGGAE